MRRRQIAAWGLLGLAGLIAAQSLRDAWNQTGRPHPGFGVLENLIVGVGGLERGGLEPFDLMRAMDGRVLTSGREIQAVVRSSPPGTTFHYILNRGSRLVEADVQSVVRTVRDFERYLLEGFTTAILFLALGAFVLWLKPGVPETRLFLVFCLTWFCLPALYLDAHSTYRFSPLFLTAVALVPAVSIHLGLTFAQRRGIVRRHPSVVWLPYGLSALIVPPLVGFIPPASPDWLLLVPAFATAYWGAALVLLIVSLGRTSLMGATPLLRQRARVLMLGFAVGQLLPVLGTTTEAIFRVSVPHLNLLWRLYFGAFLDEILRYGGDVNETAGDGLMVIFRDDDPRRHARAATLTALRILERARQIGRETDHAVGPIALHVGVNSGVAAVGATKIEGKAGTRWTYTASGSVTNVAARLAALGAGEGVLIGPETRARIHGELRGERWGELPGELPIEDLGERRLRNVAEPVHVYRLTTAGC